MKNKNVLFHLKVLESTLSPLISKEEKMERLISYFNDGANGIDISIATTGENEISIQQKKTPATKKGKNRVREKDLPRKSTRNRGARKFL